MWLAHEVAGGADRSLSAAHAYRLSGPLLVSALALALHAIVARHEVLRTAFAMRDGELFQVISEPGAPRLPAEEVAGEEELRARTSAFVREPFDLARGPMLRARLFALAADEHRLVVVFHHIANDGWSMDVFHRELAALYRAAGRLTAPADVDALIEAARLPALAVQYPDYAAWQRSLADGPEYAAGLHYWRGRLRGAPQLLALPTDRSRPAVRFGAGDRVAFGLPAELSGAVERLAGAAGVTAFTVQLAAFAALLAGWSGQRDLVIGVTTANRSLPETEDLIGFFVNVLPIRLACVPDQPFAGLVAEVHGALVAAYGHQDVPFEVILEALRVRRSPAYNPLVQVTVASHQELTDPLSLDGLAVAHLVPEGLDVQEDLTLYLTSDRAGTRGTLAFRTDLFDRVTVERLAAEYPRVLERACEHPGRPVGPLGELPTRAGPPPVAVAVEEREVPGPAPDDAVRELIADVWREVLDCGAVARDANFFELGGTSLAALRVANRLSARVGRRVPVRALFENSDLVALGRHVEALIHAALADEVAAADRSRA